MSHYNTTNLTGATLTKAEKITNEQERNIMKIIAAAGSASPSEIYIIYNSVKGHDIKFSYKHAIDQLRGMGDDKWKESIHFATVHGEAIPITSIRRAMTDLTNKGYLRKSTNSRLSIYGKKEYIWKAQGQ